MRIYAPSESSEEYVPVLGGLCGAELTLLESLLAKEEPPIRFRMELEPSPCPQVREFTLLIHREDRERADRAMCESRELVSPRLSRIKRDEWYVTALVRQ